MASFFKRFRHSNNFKPDPNENRGPFPKPSEIAQPEPEVAAETSTPGTIQELLAMQHLQPCAYGPVAKADEGSGKVQEVLGLIAELSTSPLEDQQIALALIGRLEGLHQAVVQQFQQDPEANHRSISLWSIDSDRLLHARNMLANVDLG
ncbi:hypothetical protein [Synechococcus sp. LA31]|uniref:hypothetical protein n=1 Tax=Synechococcus sp. LA31 TaxID=2741953 RepID=UPI001BDCB0D4|nr:hypothetical protein [Synechococcus sp. LA31]QVV67994.1 hypothetical protein KJJ24_02015 [Synechococcus sp. LA31]